MISHVPSRLLAVVLAVGAGAASGCSSSAGPSAFNGSWACTASTTYTFTKPSGTKPSVTSSSDSLVIDINDGQPLSVASLPTDAGIIGDGGAGCTLNFTTSGSSATLDPGQSCPITIVSGKLTYSLSLAYTTGSAMVTGTTLTFSGSETFSGDISEGNASVALAGTASSSRTCTK
jgi:hypothetical protein